MKKISYTRFLLPILFIVVVVVVWEGYVQGGGISPRILPTPSAIFAALMQNWSVVLPHIFQTLTEAIVGFGIAVVLGVFVALVLDRYIWVRNTVYPLLITSQTIPIIALAPLFLLWFGFDMLPKIIVVTLYCFFPITIALYDGLGTIDVQMTALLKSMGATRWQILRLVRFPGALPQFFSGLKIAATYAVTGAIVGEYVGGFKGLGIFMQQAANSYAIELVFVGIVITVIVSMIFVGLIHVIEYVVLSYRRN